jgi:pyruvate formate lyase activating enzyme
MAEGAVGVCKVRRNKGGKLELPYYGYVTALALDPMEKKPLYHFKPGSSIVSAGFAGCNLHCPFCQNWHISQSTGAPGRRLKPAELIASALEQGCPQIAYTYSEPLVHIEFLLDCMGEGRRQGVTNVLVTNGCVNSEAAGEILDLTDAANIDLKCFSAETYSRVLGGDLDTVLAFINRACERGVHIELTTLVVPGLNDDDAEMEKAADFIAGLSRDIPWHLSAYHPDWNCKAPPTPPALLAKFAAMARAKLPYVYTGNVAGEQNDTRCRECGAVLIRRRGYRTDTSGLVLKGEGREKTYFCEKCGAAAPVRY